jgi:flagellar hook assembly protein FlgD
MKTINSILFGISALVFSVFSIQPASAEAKILIKPDTGPINVATSSSTSLMSTSLKTRSLSIQSTIPVSATLNDTQLGVFFSSSVGVATVSVVDQYGSVIETSTIDTSSSSELYFMIDGWESGTYTLKITYGTTNLVGNFQL